MPIIPGHNIPEPGTPIVPAHALAALFIALKYSSRAQGEKEELPSSMLLAPHASRMEDRSRYLAAHNISQQKNNKIKAASVMRHRLLYYNFDSDVVYESTRPHAPRLS